MRIRTLALPVVLALVASSCGKRERAPEEAPDRAGTTAGSRPAPGGDATAPEAAPTTIGGPATTASSVAETGAPMPPGGYAVDSRPAAEGALARIEYATPRTVAEAAEFYDTQIRAARRIELELPGDNAIVYGLSPNTSITVATTIQDVERIIEQRREPLLFIRSWTIGRNDPLVKDLRAAGLSAQADSLLLTRSKVTVVYAIR